MTEETMDDIAQWQHDTAWEFEPVEFPTEADVENCEIDYLTECLNGEHSVRFELVGGTLTYVCEDGCS